MTTDTIDTAAEREIRASVESWVRALHDRDIDRIMSHYASEVLAFDAIAELQFKGVDAYGKHFAACLDMCPGPMTFEVHDLQVTAGRDIAFSHYLCRCGGTNDKGEEQSGWMRATVCHRRIDGRWLIVHEHYSAPFEPESGKALFDLNP